MMIHPRTLSLATAIVAAALTLTACGGTPAAAPTVTVTVAPPSTPSSSPTPTTAPVAATVPGSCDEIGTATTRAATVDSMTLQGDGTGFVRPAPEGATLELGCDWIVGDATGILLLISEAAPSAVTAAVAGLPAEGYTCSTAKAGNPLCEMDSENSQYGTKTMETIYARDGVWIYMSATNIDGGQLLSDLAVEMWK